MSDDIATLPPRSLPERPNLEHLKNQARRHLRSLRAGQAETRLADAQLAIARAYGFASWRALKAHVEAPFANLTGFYRHDSRTMDNAVVEVSLIGGRLHIETAQGARLRLSRRDDGQFIIAGMENGFTFEDADHGLAKALISHQADATVRLDRIDEAQAQAIRAARQAALADQHEQRVQANIEPALLYRYVGHYALPLGPTIEISIQGAQLLAQVAGQPTLAVYPESETVFFYRILPAQLSFELGDGEAVAVVLHQNGLLQRMERVSAERAEQISAQIRARQAAQERPRTPISVDPAILDRYAGRYRLDTARDMIVSREGASLFMEFTGDRRFEVYAESETSFFWTIAAAQVTFALDDSGQVTHAVLHQSGRDIPLPRLPLSSMNHERSDA